MLQILGFHFKKPVAGEKCVRISGASPEFILVEGAGGSRPKNGFRKFERF